MAPLYAAVRERSVISSVFQPGRSVSFAMETA